MYDHTQYFVVMENCMWNRWLVRPHSNAPTRKRELTRVFCTRRRTLAALW
jgi:hypothetical protein